MKYIIKTITLSALASSILLGVEAPTIGDIEREVQQPKIEKEKALIPQIKLKEYKAPMKDSGKAIFIASFTFSGNSYISSEKLQELAKKYVKQNLSFKQLNELASRITKLYRKKGYFVARAYIPAQNILEKDNVLEISIIEGNYGEFKLDNNSLVKQSVIQGILDYAKREDIVSTRTLEQSMLLINDTPGVIVTKADVMPGKELGTSDFSITTQATNPYSGYIVADNYGSRYTGENRAMAGLDFNSPFGIGDKISLSTLLSEKTDLKNGKLSYSVPLMSNGLTGELSYSQTNYSLVQEYESLDAKGTSKTLEGKLSYPLVRTKLQNLYANLFITSKDLTDEIGAISESVSKDTKSLKVELDYAKNYLAFGMNTNSNISLAYTYGKLSFDNQADELDDKNGADTSGTYSKLNLILSHNIAFNSDLSLESSLKLQYALNNKNLDGSEDFSVGGAYGVKLYPDSELSAENGYVFSTELKYKLPQFYALNSSIGLFYDIGRVSMADNTVGFASRTLQDIGVGYYASYGKFFTKFQAAFKIGNEDVTSEPDTSSRILLQGGLSF